MNRPLQRLWVIAYDIEDDAVRRRVSTLLEDQGQRVQYSVFECWLDRHEINTLQQRLQHEIESGDSLRWYPLCRACHTDVQSQGSGVRPVNEKYYLP